MEMCHQKNVACYMNEPLLSDQVGCIEVSRFTSDDLASNTNHLLMAVIPKYSYSSPVAIICLAYAPDKRKRNQHF